jgi:hypothetical protein
MLLICVNIRVGWEFNLKIIVSSKYLKQAKMKELPILGI